MATTRLTSPRASPQRKSRSIEQQHVPVLLGALWTPVTHAIMPIVQEAKVPLVIDISAGQDFVDASGVGGNDYVFKTIPSDRDIAIGMMNWLKERGVKCVAIIADDNDFNKTNAASMETAAKSVGLEPLANEIVPKDTKDLATPLAKLRALKPDVIVTVLSASTAPFFQAYEQASGKIAISGRVDFAGAIHAVRRVPFQGRAGGRYGHHSI